MRSGTQRVSKLLYFRKGRTMKQLAFVVIAVVLLAGCTSVPSDTNRISSASYVGDSAGMSIEEVVVAVPCKEVQSGFVNVHVVLTGIINPKKTSLSNTWDVQSILSRLSPRISSAVTVVIQQEPAPTENLIDLRDRIVKVANRVFAGEFSKWTSAEDYDVQIVVTSLYLTNGSVGRSGSGHSRWEW